MKKALIFGMDGFVGKYLANELSLYGYEIYASGRHGYRYNDDCSGWYTCDLTDMDNVKNVVAEVNPTYIINLAGQSNVGISWRIPKRTFEANVCGPINIIEAVSQCGIDCSILMIGSSEEYDISNERLNEECAIKGSNPYGISKITLENYCEIYKKKYGMKIHFTRVFNHTGVGQNDNFVIPSWCKQAADIAKNSGNGKMIVGNLDIVRDFSNVKDVVCAYRLIIESEDYNTIYNVGSGKGIMLRDILNHIIKISKCEICIEVDKKLIRPIENPYICCNNELITKNLGWKPKYDIYSTVQEIYDYYLNNRT